ncbi:MAG: hypothetical protein QXF25_01840 [Candidatus Pacearchaeota archaeon]
MNKWLELLVGIVLVVGMVVFALKVPTWGLAAWEFFKGGLIWFVGMIGVLFLLLGISDLKE